MSELELAVMNDPRAFIFKGIKPCTNHGCVIAGKRQGIGTNGLCHCMTDNITRNQLDILGQRLNYLLELMQRERSKS